MISEETISEFLASEIPDRSTDNPIFRYAAKCAYNVLRSHTEAGGVAYDVFNRCHAKRSEFRGNSIAQFRAWIGRSATNRATDLVRKAARERARLATWASFEHVPAEYRDLAVEMHRQEVLRFLRVQVFGAPDELSEFEQDAMRCRYYVCLSVAGTAAHLKVGQKSVQNAVYTAKRKLRERALADGLVAQGDHLDEARVEPSRENGTYRGRGDFITHPNGRTWSRRSH